MVETKLDPRDALQVTRASPPLLPAATARNRTTAPAGRGGARNVAAAAAVKTGRTGAASASAASASAAARGQRRAARAAKSGATAVDEEATVGGH